jgi:hypothetical protein
MFMISKVELLWRDVERARRVAHIQSEMDSKEVWKNVRVFDPVKDAEDRFARELIFVYPDFREYCFELEKMVHKANDKASALQHELNQLKEVPTNPKKPRKPRAKKAK